jgi:(1->4)-alpha-D-glucan 1-alpha-D-glucosylmutase
MTEAPGIWAEAVGRWRKMNETCVRTLADGPAPEPALEWMIYQALAGVWPAELRAKDKEGLQALESRFVPFVEKAVREAKLRTNWADPDETYEAAVIGYARRLLLPGNNAFIEDFVDTLQPFIRAGLVNSLAGTIIKLAAPGVPDIYQGCEGLDFSLVDPDNRREPDFSTLQQHLTRDQHPARPTDRDWLSGSLKQRVIRTLLRLRQQAEPLFRTGAYLPLEVTGTGAETVIAFARAERENALVVAAPRLAFDAMRGRSFSEFSLTEAEIALPRQLSNRAYRDVWTGEPVEVADVLKGDLLQGQPCLALWAD